jgi:hypothetical protein
MNICGDISDGTQCDGGVCQYNLDGTYVGEPLFALPCFAHSHLLRDCAARIGQFDGPDVEYDYAGSARCSACL